MEKSRDRVNINNKNNIVEIIIIERKVVQIKVMIINRSISRVSIIRYIIGFMNFLQKIVKKVNFI